MTSSSPIEKYSQVLLVQNWTSSTSGDIVVVETDQHTDTASASGLQPLTLRETVAQVNVVGPQQILIHPELYRAAEEGDLQLLQQLLQDQDLQQPDVGPISLQGQTIGGNTVLHIAATATSSADLSWQQLQKGDYVEFAKAGYLRNRQLLLARNKLKETPLHCAVKVGNYTMVSLLISFAEHERQDGDDTLLTARNIHGETALHEAVRIGIGYSDIVNRLILSEPRLIAIVDAEGVSPLYLAAMTNALDIVQIFTREEPSMTMLSCAGPKGQTALHAAVLEHTGITHALLEWNKALAVKVDDSESTPLHYAASVGNLATVKLLLQYEKSAAYMADKDGLYPIHIAAKCGRASVVKELIEQFRDSDELLDKEGRNFLHLAIISGKGNIISGIRQNRTFLRMLNARDYQGNTALHLAVAGQKGEYRIVRFLISMKKVHTTTMNRNGLTPVDLATKDLAQGFIQFILSTKFNLLRCMLWTGALPSPRRFDHFGNDLNVISNDIQKLEVKNLESAARGLIIVSVLIATVTFAAIFTMPGGYIGNDDHANVNVNGESPILSRKYAFNAFIVADLLAFLLSILATAWLIYVGSATVDFELRMICQALSVEMLKIAGKATVCAFALATYVVLYQVNLQISILVLVVSFAALPLTDPAYSGVLLLTSPIVKRVGWTGLLKSHLRPSTRKRVSVVFGIGRNFSACLVQCYFECFSVQSHLSIGTNLVKNMANELLFVRHARCAVLCP